MRRAGRMEELCKIEKQTGKARRRDEGQEEEEEEEVEEEEGQEEGEEKECNRHTSEETTTAFAMTKVLQERNQLVNLLSFAFFLPLFFLLLLPHSHSAFFFLLLPLPPPLLPFRTYVIVGSMKSR
jgi:hypothetical protein